MIDPERVDAVFMNCLFNNDEIDENGKPRNGIEPIKVEGIMSWFGFHPKRIESHSEEIINWLSELPHQFRKSQGGGWTFLNACNIEDGQQWTGLHQRMEQLFCLGIGIGKVKYAMPRDMWKILPGGMPYLVIDL